MLIKSRMIGIAGLLAALAWGGTSSAQGTFSLTGANDGVQWQIGTGLPLPVGTAGIFFGGMSMADAATFPPLNMPPAPGKAVVQDLTTAQGGAVRMPAGLFARAAGPSPNVIPLFPSNPAVFQVGTSIDFAFPSTQATFAPGGGPGAAVFFTTFGAGDAVISYSGGSKAFGGAAQFLAQAGPGAGTGQLNNPTNTAANGPPVASVWINFLGKAPATVTQVALVGAGGTNSLARVGASVNSPPVTTMWGPGGVVVVNVNRTTTANGAVNADCCIVGPVGTINSSVGPVAAFPSNMVIGSKGFPWTTGTITISHPRANGGPEVFFLKGTDTRVAGVGNLSLVSGALSDRTLSGPNANRGWLRMTLPEPQAALGAMGALALLGLCHGLVRRGRGQADQA